MSTFWTNSFTLRFKICNSWYKFIFIYQLHDWEGIEYKNISERFFLWKSFFTMIIFFLFHCWFLQHLHVFLILLLRWAIITAQCFSLSERLCIYIMRHTVTVFEPFSFQIIIIILYDFVHITLPFWNSFDKTIQGSTSFGCVLHWVFFPLRDSFFPFNLCILPLVSCNRYAMWLVTDWESLFSHFLKCVLGSFFPLYPRRNFAIQKIDWCSNLTTSNPPQEGFG